MYNEKLEALIEAALEDGVLTEKEKQVLFKNAQAMGVDLDEFEMVLDARLVKKQKELNSQEDARIENEIEISGIERAKTRVCPKCGRPVPPMATKCTCGYYFEIEANSSAKLLAEKIDQIIQDASKQKAEVRKNKEMLKLDSEAKQRLEEKISKMGKTKGIIMSTMMSSSSIEEACDEIDDDAEARIKNLIKTFPIPSSKEDLFEFITSLKSKVDNNDDYEDEYKTKYDECIEKVRALFPNDNLFAQILKKFDEETVKTKRKKKITIIILACVFIIILGVILINVIPRASNDPKKCNKAISSAIKKGNLDEAKDYYFEYKGKYSYDIDVIPLINAYVEKGDMENAKQIASKKGYEYEKEYDEGKREIAAILYKGYMELGKYDDAWEVVKTGREYKYGGRFIKDVCTKLCEEGKKDEAYSFVKRNEDKIDDSDDELIEFDSKARKNGKTRRGETIKYLNDYIKNY